MSWAKGAEIFDSVILAVKEHVDDPETRRDIYRPIAAALGELDWDTQEDCMGKDTAADDVLRELFPDNVSPEEDENNPDDGEEPQEIE